jgi:predicted nucleic acid-binding protein
VSDEVFLDSGIFIAFLVESDRLHGEAVRLFSTPPRRWSTSVLVVSETYSWFLHRAGEDAARTFRELLGSLVDLEVLDAGEEHREAVWMKLDAVRGLKLTFVDASSLVRIAERKIATVWATDRHLAIEGATVVPGPWPGPS